MPEVTWPASSGPPMNEDGHVLKSRRGLLAAGLAVAVVGTIGVASTLSAGAEQIPAAGPAAPAPVAAEDDEPTPPPVLPWGGRPQKIKKGSPGATSKTLRAAGLSAAAADTSGSTVPKARYGPKGRSDRTTFLKSERNQFAAPPEPEGETPAGSKVFYNYSTGSQAAETDGAYANLMISKPILEKTDYHSLAEIAVQSADGRQIVEVGWTVDRAVNGDDDPHLFVYHWVNRKPSCYNGCGFESYGGNVKPGDTLQYDVAKKFGIQYFNQAWWIAYDSEWIGFFPDTLWSKEGVTFNRSGLVQMFGEVASPIQAPCTDMGNGQTSEKETAARVGSVSYINGPTVAMTLRSSPDINPEVKPSPLYSIGYSTLTTTRTFRYGGPGTVPVDTDKDGIPDTPKCTP